jgi:DNA-binding response OmpR family regulator
MTATDIAIPALGGPRVLVAETDPDSSVALTAMLRLQGFDAREARTGSAAIAAVVKIRPQVLILDLDLPDFDGCELIRHVRKEPDPPAVVVVTGHTTDGLRKAAVAAGASAYLLKPADPGALAGLVLQLCDRV